MSPVFHFPGMGTLVNMLLIIGGSLIGMFFGKRFPQRVREIVMQASGLVVLAFPVCFPPSSPWTGRQSAATTRWR